MADLSFSTIFRRLVLVALVASHTAVLTHEVQHFEQATPETCQLCIQSDETDVLSPMVSHQRVAVDSNAVADRSNDTFVLAFKWLRPQPRSPPYS